MYSKFMNAKSIYSNIMNLGIHEAISFYPFTQKQWGCQTDAKSEHPKVVQNSSLEWVVEWLL